MADAKQPQAYTADGKPVAAEDTAAAVREGRAFFQKGQRVYAKNEAGDLVTVAAEDASLPGYRVLSDEQIRQARLKKDAESASGMAKTVGEGVVRGATLGFAEPSMLYDAEGREAALARQRYNPGLSGGSELAGAVGGGLAAALLSGGAGGAAAARGVGSAAARMGGRAALSPWLAADAVGGLAERGVARALGDGLLARGAALGARGAAEGAVAGAGHEVSQSVLEDTPLTAERLLAGAAEGAGTGAILGGGIGVLGRGLGKAGEAMLGRMQGGSSLEGALRGFAERRAFKQVTGNARKFFDEATDHGSNMARPERIGRKLIDAGIPEEAGAAISAVSARADEAASRLRTIAAEMDGAGVRVDTAKILGQVDDQIARIRETPSAAFQKVAKRIESEIRPFRKAVDDGQSFTFSDLWGLRQKLDQTIRWESKQRGPAEEALRDMVGAFRSELDDSIERAIATDATGAVQRAEMAAAAPGALDGLDDLSGLAGRSANDAAPTGQVSGDLLGRWKQAKEDYADFALAKKAAKDLAIRNEKNRFFSPSDYGTGGLMGGVMAVLSGSGLAGVATSMAAGAAHKLIRERGAGVLARIADRSAAVAGRMEIAGKVAALVESPKRLGPAVAVSVSKLFDRYMAELSKDDAETAAHVGDATADLGLRYPDVAAAVQKAMLEDRKYLRSVEPIPQTRVNATMTPRATPAVYAFDAKKAFVDAATALDDPMSVFDDIARGDLPLSKIRALKVRRPGLWGEMRQTVARHAVRREEALPYSRRVLLGVAFDFPSDWSMVHVAEIQGSLAAPDEKAKTDPRAAPSKVDDDPGAAISPDGFGLGA